MSVLWIYFLANELVSLLNARVLTLFAAAKLTDSTQLNRQLGLSFTSLMQSWV